jgi:CDP-glucose 4,6-dehydratase
MQSKAAHMAQMFGAVYQGARVLVTGHTGFKGSWLCQWLLRLGAEVHGYARDPQPHETLFGQLGLGARLASDTRADVCDIEALRRTVDRIKPNFVFHLAAQPLVRLSFEIPVETFATNVMGTVHLLDCLRDYAAPFVCVVVTTDKCYENREWLHAYREEDAMGGYDPYSASKGCAELVTSAFRRSYFQGDHNRRVASARAGNVIGGGDWAKDRIVPDIFRALRAGEPIPVRNKLATRPWQHVLEPLSGYLWLAASLHDRRLARFPITELSSGFNFGPSLASNRTVAEVVESVLQRTPGKWVDRSDPNAVHEAEKLNLATDKAFHMLGWSPTWGFDETIQRTVEWYTDPRCDSDARELTMEQIEAYESHALGVGKSWAVAAVS